MADLNEELVKEAIKKAEEDVENKAADAKEAVETAAEETAEKVEGVVEDIAEEQESSDENAEDASEDGDETDEEGKKKFSFFKKDKKEKKDPKDEKIEELNDKLMRNLAEFENFRKRTEKEKAMMFEIGAKSIIEKVLPALDSFDLGIAGLSEEDKNSPVGQGMEKVYKQLMTSLESAGLKSIDAVGKEFDPNLHNAVMHEDNDEFGENTVSQELQKGYMYNDTVVRHSMVKVAN